MVAVPADTPVTSPVKAPIVAIAVLLLLQELAGLVVVEYNVAVSPSQRDKIPVIGPGPAIEITFTTPTAVQVLLV
jgi:hypothetical protein